MGKSRGFGTIVLANAEDAQLAIQMLNGYSFQGRPIEVREDRNASAGSAPALGAAVGEFQLTKETFYVARKDDRQEMGISLNTVTREPWSEIGDADLGLCGSWLIDLGGVK